MRKLRTFSGKSSDILSSKPSDILPDISANDAPESKEKWSPDPFMMLMMTTTHPLHHVHHQAAFLAFFDALLTLLFFALPHQALGSPSQISPCDTPPHTPFIHFVHPKNSSLAYRLAFVIIHTTVIIYHKSICLLTWEILAESLHVNSL